MISSLKEFFDKQKDQVLVMDQSILLNEYAPIDLSISNNELKSYDITDPNSCQEFVDRRLKATKSKIAYGGYLEKRDIYKDKSGFNDDGDVRNIHLGIDFWAPVNTVVIAPLPGRVHSFKNNASVGDYGPTIILEHDYEGTVFHTLYGHLSLDSIKGLYKGKTFDKGDIVARLGSTDINVHYAPHLHFQIILDMEGKSGDYPGVCSEDTVEFYSKNCPDPNILLKIS